MKKEQLAKLLNGREYRNEITDGECLIAKENGLVVVFGASDDLMEFRGAIYEETDCWNGGVAFLDKNGLVENECDDECPYFEISIKSKTKIESIWQGEDGFCWTYKINIPYATFDIFEENEKWCWGIVFSLKDCAD